MLPSPIVLWTLVSRLLMSKWRLTPTVEEDRAERPLQTMSRSRQGAAAGEQTTRIPWGHLASPTAAEKGCGRPLLPIRKGTHLPGQVLLGPRGCRQVDAQHDGVRWGGEDAGDDGISHVEGKHGVDHEDDKEEEGHLQREGKQECQKIPVLLLCKQAENKHSHLRNNVTNSPSTEMNSV